MRKNLILGIFGTLALCLMSPSGAEEVNIQQRIPMQAYDKCHFSIRKTTHIGISSQQRDFALNNKYGYCGLNLDGVEFRYFGDFSLLIAPNREHNDDRREGEAIWDYFVKNSNGQWDYPGGSTLSLNSKVLAKSFRQESLGDEITLVGKQVVEGLATKGQTTLLPNTQILRVTPTFYVSTELYFDDTYVEKKNSALKRLREAINDELVEIVNSVQFEPEANGPSIRP